MNYRFPVQGYFINELQHEISKNVVCATSKASDQPAHMEVKLPHSWKSHVSAHLLIWIHHDEHSADRKAS